VQVLPLVPPPWVPASVVLMPVSVELSVGALSALKANPDKATSAAAVRMIRFTVFMLFLLFLRFVRTGGVAPSIVLIMYI
jgi:hypothetical protein